MPIWISMVSGPSGQMVPAPATLRSYPSLVSNGVKVVAVQVGSGEHGMGVCGVASREQPPGHPAGVGVRRLSSSLGIVMEDWVTFRFAWEAVG
jgi:hypothetical protein